METERLPSGVFFNFNRHLHHANPYHVDQKPLPEGSTTLPFRSGPSEEPPFHQQFFVKRQVSGMRRLADGNENDEKDGERDDRHYLPLLEVSMSVEVVATTSRTVLSQSFSNLSNMMITESTYCFPLYDGSIVVGFRCWIGEDRLLEGIVKPKEQAKAEFKEAVSRQRAAVLLEEVTPEVFETSLGNIPPQTVVKVEIQYINQLKAHLSGDGVLVTIPTSIAPRYGSSPICASSSTVSPAENGLKIQVEVSSSVPIRKLESRTHPISVELGYTSGPAILSSFAALAVASASGPPNAEFDPRKAKATLSDKSTSLGRDFVLLIFASNKNILTSSAILEQHPTLRGLSALQVNISPGQLFTPEGAMDGISSEIIFLADRSGSMGEKIKVLQSALGKSIKSIPPNYSFNIHSFGSSQSALWKDSRLCTQENVDLALQHLTNDFTANMGGTEILSALQNAVQTRTRREDMKTEIILLTDGEAWDAEHIIEFVRDTRTETNQKVRFFALGIGDAVSHRLVEGIGRQGGGFAEIVAVDAIGNWEAEVIRMLKGALTPSQWQCKVELPEGSGTAHSMSLEDFLPTQLPIPRPIAIQAPYKTPFFHAFTRTSVYFFLDPQLLAGRSRITIKGVESSGKTFRTDIPLEEVQLQSQTIHCLAAKALMSDLETGQSWMHADKHHEYRIKNSNDFERHVQQEAEQIGMKWSISGKWTSFVAVADDGQEEQKSRIYLAERSELADLTRPRGATYIPTYNQDNHANLARGSAIRGSLDYDDYVSAPLGGLARAWSQEYTMTEINCCPPDKYRGCGLWYLNDHLRRSHSDTHLRRLYTMTLKEIISLQTVEGSFSLPDELTTTFQDIYRNSDVVHTIKNAMQTKSCNADAENEIAAKIFLTLLIISIIEQRFFTEIDMWLLVAQKVDAWVHGYLEDGSLGWNSLLRISYAKRRNA